MLTYEDWYDKVGYKLEEEILDWYNRCPSSFLEDLFPEPCDILNDEYESYVGDYEDRAYDEYKDSLLED